MSFRCLGLVVLMVLSGSCAPQAPRREQPADASDRQQALATITLAAPVKLANSVFLPPPSITFGRAGRLVPYREADLPAHMEKNRVVFHLQPVDAAGAIIQYEVTESRDHAECTLRFWSGAPLPDMTLHSAAPKDLVPVRLKAPGDRGTLLSVAQDAPFASCEALYNPALDFAVLIDQPFQYSPSGFVGINFGEHDAREARIKFVLVPDVAKHRFDAARRPPKPTATAPADWCLQASTSSAGSSPDLRSWLSSHLGAAPDTLVQVPAQGGLPALLCSRGKTNVTAPADPAGPGPAWKTRFDKAREIHSRVLERGPRYNWQHAKELMNTALIDYWSHGIVESQMAAPLLLGPPLTQEHARMWVSLVGLSGQGVVIGDDPRTLDAERLDLLRAILPPPAVRNANLFTSSNPPQWLVSDFRSWFDPDKTRPPVLEPIFAIGVFNWSAEEQRVKVRLSELVRSYPAPNAPDRGGALAVFDCWRRQLFATTDDAFEVPLAPASCRVFRVLPVPAARPQLIGAGPHLIQRDADAEHLVWNAGELVISASSAVVARQPFELCFLLPAGASSFEVDRVTGANVSAPLPPRSVGPLRFITLEPQTTGRVSWSVHFRRQGQASSKSAEPAQLQAAQNTRGVLLRWKPEETASVYRVYRNDRLIGETSEVEYQDSTALYRERYTYAVTALDASRRESARSTRVALRMSPPAGADLSDLVPLLAEQEHLGVMTDASAAGQPLQVAGKRYQRGLGTHSRARLVYFLGGGYETFTGQVGIDDETRRQGSCVFKILADGEPLFTSKTLRGGDPAQPFSVRVAGKTHLALLVTDGGDNPDNDHADWLEPRLITSTP